MPDLVKQLARSTGNEVIHASSAPGGFTFSQHGTEPATLSLIAQGNWHYVVLQEQSQRPSFPDAQVEADVYPYAKKLDSIVRKQNACAKTLFYMTWGRKNGDAGNCGFFPPLCTYAGMDSLLQLRYTNMADSVNGLISPVAKVWRYLRTNNPSIDLYDADESHPSLAGSYAAACAFYAVMFKKDPVLCTYNGGLSATDAATIKAAAKKVAFDSLSRWYAYNPVTVTTSFGHNISGNQVSFTNTSTGATSYKWYFGDGDSSTAQNPTHTYAANGSYNVKLVAYKCTDSDTETKTVNLTTAAISAPAAFDVKIYPNPVSDFLHIQADNSIEQINVRNIVGEILHPNVVITNTAAKVDVSDMASGNYMLEIISDKGSRFIRIVRVN